MPRGHNQHTESAGLTAKAPRWSLRVSVDDDEKARELAAENGYELAEWVRLRSTTEGVAIKKKRST